MGQSAYPRGTWQFAVDIDGVNQFNIQKVVFPSLAHNVREHHELGRKVKNPGQIEVGDMTWEMIVPADTIDNRAYEWFRLVRNIRTGGGSLPQLFKRNVVIRELAFDEQTTLTSHICEQIWLKEVTRSDGDRASSDNLIRTMVWSVEIYDPR